MKNNNSIKIRKCFHLVSSMQTRPVNLALALFGLTPAEIAKGQGLVLEAQRLATVGRPKVARTDAWKRIVKWAKTWIPIVAVSLRLEHPAVFASVFDGIEPASALDTPFVLNLVTDRLLALAASDAAEDKAAWAELGERKLTAEMVSAIRKDLLEGELFEASDVIADPARRDARDAAVAAAWRFYLRWSVIGRSVVKDKRILRMMGIHAGKQGLSEEETVEAPATPESPVAPATPVTP